MNIISSVRKHLKNRTLTSAVLRRISMPFLLRPRLTPQPTGSYATSHLEKGAEYHALFSERPGRSLMWQFEQGVLQSCVERFGDFNCHLDFAGGTGRISSILGPAVVSQVVLDISPTMLEVARQKLSKATIMNFDFRESNNSVEDKTFDLVTAFRFFPNAEPSLRAEAFAFLSRKIKDKGYMICNNHRNFWSIPYMAMRLTMIGGDVGMTNSQVIRLASINGFELVETHSFGILPQSERKALFGWRVTAPVEKALYKRLGRSHKRGYNVVYVFRRAPRTS